MDALRRAESLAETPNPALTLSLGTALLRTGASGEAVDVLLEGAKRFPRAAPILVQLGYTHYTRLDGISARAVLRRARAVAPNNAQAPFYLGLAEAALGALEPAAEAFGKAVILDPRERRGPHGARAHALPVGASGRGSGGLPGGARRGARTAGRPRGAREARTGGGPPGTRRRLLRGRAGGEPRPPSGALQPRRRAGPARAPGRGGRGAPPVSPRPRPAGEEPGRSLSRTRAKARPR